METCRVEGKKEEIQQGIETCLTIVVCTHLNMYLYTFVVTRVSQLYAM